MLFRCLLFVFICCLSFCANAQPGDIKAVPGLPTKEVYDLHIDSKGFLWIAHDLGISRYDGVNFTSYSNPEQTSLSATDLLEDKYGRIWFHNFTGQIFYIQDGRVHLLKSYDAKREVYFPRMVIYKDQLVATSNKGIFTCDLKTLKSRYLQPDAPRTETTSLTVLGDKVVAFGNGYWFIWQAGSQLRRVNADGDKDYIKKSVSTLIAQCFNKTAYIISNPEGVLGTVQLSGDSLKIAGTLKTGDFLNTVSINRGRAWLNMRHKSFALDKPSDAVTDQDLSDIVTDNEGNTWYSSLKNGLMVKKQRAPGGLVPVNVVGERDGVTALLARDSQLVIGTESGRILLYDPKDKVTTKVISLPNNPGSIAYIGSVGSDDYLIGTSINTYRVNIVTGKVYFYPDIKTLKQVWVNNDFMFIASARNLYALPSDPHTDLAKVARERFKGMHLIKKATGDMLSYNMRLRAVCYNERTGALYAAFKDGLFLIDKTGVHPYLYKGNTVNTASLSYVNGTVFFGTINDGLIADDGKQIRQFNTDNGLPSNNILKIKRTNNWLWLFGAGTLPGVYDIEAKRPVTGINLNSLTNRLLTGIEVLGKKAYVATPDGFFSFEYTMPVKKMDLHNYLQSITVNNKALTYPTAHDLEYFENNIQFSFAVPFFSQAESVYFRYMLTGTNNPNWQITRPGVRTVNFSELAPGKYTLKAYAVHPQYGTAAKPITYDFIIHEQWWKTWWFRLIFIATIVGLAGYIVANYFYNRLQLQKAIYERELSIQNERQRISSEMHDDVGAGLSAIKLYMQMAENSPTKAGDLTRIGAMINDMADKINEIIWSTNTGNDTVEGLIYYLEFQSYKLFEHSGINFRAVVPVDVPNHSIEADTRRNIYLLIKEFLHNSLKHSRATEVSLKIDITKTNLHALIRDNGRGFDASANFNGMGMKNARTRTERLKAKMNISSNGEGTTIALDIPL